MNGACTHAEYYGQFVTPEIIKTVADDIGVERIKKSTDAHLNDIPLHQWDRQAQAPAFAGLGAALKAAGDTLSLSSIVCVAKVAAKQIKACGEAESKHK